MSLSSDHITAFGSHVCICKSKYSSEYDVRRSVLPIQTPIQIIRPYYNYYLRAFPFITND